MRHKPFHRFNWRRDRPDHRDFRPKLQEVITLPTSADLRPLCPPIVDQGSIGSCTANALAGLLGFCELRQLGDRSGKGPEELALTYEPFSRLFIYYNERDLEGDPLEDGGAEIRDGIKTLNQIGACSELTWTYDASMTFKRPVELAYQEASSHKITTYVRLSSLYEIKKAISEGNPVAFGFTCFDSLESPEVAQSGILPMPGPDEGDIGGHAVVAVGYDDGRQLVLVRNSWGTGWGLQGYFWMPYNYIQMLASDFWMITK